MRAETGFMSQRNSNVKLGVAILPVLFRHVWLLLLSFERMSESASGLVASADQSKIRPDYFAYYIREVKELLSKDEDFLPFASGLTGNGSGDIRGTDAVEQSCNGSRSFFVNSVGTGFSGFKKERLNSMLRQAVAAFTPEVDEMLDPAVSMRWLQSQVRGKKFVSDSGDAASEGNTGQVPNKRQKMLSSPSSAGISALSSPASSGSCSEGPASRRMDSKYSTVALNGEGIPNVVQKRCTLCSTAITSQWRTDPEGKILCVACRNGREYLWGPNACSEKKNGEGNDDLQFLLENDSSLVEEIMKKYSDELLTTLGHMEQQLEELLDTVVSTCRQMSVSEKQHLQKLIQKLPPKSLNRVVEIIQHGKQGETRHCDEIFVDLEQQDNVTLWRLYYYVEAVEKAKNLSLRT